jgi:hypothetical protein
MEEPNLNPAATTSENSPNPRLRRIGSLCRTVTGRAILFAATLLLAAVPSSALETDQYWAWGRPLADSTDAVNAKFNLELERAIASFPVDRPPESCRKVSIAYRKRMRFILMHEIQIWAWNSALVARIPDGSEEQREYRKTNLYSNHPLIDPATWMPYTPTIMVAGVRMGTDKLAHFVSSGWTFYGEYRKGLAKGATPDEAERRAVRRGIVEESLILGGMTSGIQAIADLEASHAGLRFYRDLCDADEPILRREEGRWRISRPVDLRDYVTPRWDESFQPSVFGKARWRKVRPLLESYCGRLDDPLVVQERRLYRERDEDSLVAEIVAQRVAEGRYPDPAQFGIEAVCSASDPSRQPAEAPGAPASAVDSNALVDRIVAEEENRRGRILGLGGAHLSYPQGISASIAVMFSSQPASYDCGTPCDLRGPFVELEPGLGGGKLSLGWSRVSGTTNRSGSFLKAAYIGAAIKATVLRTWGDLGWVESGRTYTGVEFGLPVAQANLGVGLLYRVDSGDGHRWLVTGSIGWGF